MIVELLLLAVTIWILVGVAVYFVFFKKESRNNPASKAHTAHDFGFAHRNKSKKRLVGLRENSKPKNSADEKANEIRRLIEETTKKLENIKIQP